MEKIFDDFQLLGPTILSSTPRLYNQIYQEYQNALQSLRMQNLDDKEFELQESLLLQKFSKTLGGFFPFLFILYLSIFFLIFH